MDSSGVGTAVMLALAAVLWFVYLVPNWVRRREYLATERNATRLQRTIRVMAETAEAPDEYRLELSARDAAQQEKLLRQEQRRVDAHTRAELRAAAAQARLAEAHAAEVEQASRAAERQAADRIAAAQARAVAAGAAARTDARAGLRRARRLAGLLALAGVVTALVQGWLMLATGAAPGAWVVLAGSAVAITLSVALQRRVAMRIRMLAPVSVQPAARRASSPLLDAEPIAVEASRGWTPVPVPKPLYVQHQEAPREPVVPRVSSEQLLRAAAAEAERALEAAHAEPEVVKFPTRVAEAPAAPVTAPAPSRYASMGRIDADAAQLNLDEIMQRRRSG